MSLRPWYNQDANFQTNSKSFMDYLGRTNKFLEVLIEDYEIFQELVNEELERIKFNAEMEVEDILLNWLDDGTLERIINETIFNQKLDKTTFEAYQNEVDNLFNTLQTDVTNQLNNQKDETTDLINQTGTNLRKDIEQHGFNLRWNEHLVVDGDWTQALQQALDDSPDDGRTIFIGQDIRIDSSIIWPNIAGDTSIMKPCTIQGMAKNRGSGVITGYQKGEVAIEFTGDGALFDLRNGNESQTNSSVSIRDISLYGKGKEGSFGIHADSLLGANFENMQFRGFDVGMRAREVFYATFDNLRFFYNSSYGLNVEGEVNHTKFHRCNFGNSTDGIGVRVYYGQTGVVFDGCWFEGNETAVSLDYCMQALFQGCYFEENHNTLDILGHLETGQTTVTIIGSNISTKGDSRNSPIVTSGNTKYLISMIGNTFFHWQETGLLIGGNGDKHIVDINNHTRGLKFDYPDNISLSVNENGTYAKQLNAGAQLSGDVTGSEKVGRMEVFNRNGVSAGWVQLYEGLS